VVKISWGMFDTGEDNPKPMKDVPDEHVPKSYTVRGVSRQRCMTFILRIHYAKRIPPISYAFGLFEEDTDNLLGIVTYGTPLSAPLKKCLAGEEFKNDILELNRLVLLHNRKNEASMLVGRSIKLLPRDKIIVSFADVSQNHVGFIYQATNFLYTGLSTENSDLRIKGRENMHPITLQDEFRGVENRADAIREHYGDACYMEKRPRKHRYVYLHGSKTFRKKAFKALKYAIEDYPKVNVQDLEEEITNG